MTNSMPIGFLSDVCFDRAGLACEQLAADNRAPRLRALRASGLGESLSTTPQTRNSANDKCSMTGTQFGVPRMVRSRHQQDTVGPASQHKGVGSVSHRCGIDDDVVCASSKICESVAHPSAPE